MIDIPAAQIISTIQEQKGLSESEIREKISDKLKQLAGLISEDGAAHIIANELGVQLATQQATVEAKIKDLAPGMRSVSVPGKVARKYELREFNSNGRQGKVASFMLGDETGQVRVTLWNEQTDLFEKFNDGDTLRISNAFVKENRGYPELHLNADSKLEVSPAGVEIRAQRRDAERKMIKELSGDEENVEVLGTIVQVYDPRFFDVCPQCNRRVTDNGGSMSCATHGAVTPVSNYVVSAFIDDGTGNIRTTFWKQQTQRLLGKEDTAVLAYKDNPLAFEAMKTDLLGEIVKVVGRCKKNETFDRIELTANLIFKDINPEEELARMSEESSAQQVAQPDVPVQKAVTPEPIVVAQEVKPVEAPVPEEKPAAPQKPTVIMDDELTSNSSEEAISLDDLEDLDEQI